jgi:hypothetical protein
MAVSFSAHEFESALVLSQLPPREEFKIPGSRPPPPPSRPTLVDMYIATVLDVEWKGGRLEVAEAPPAEILHPLMEELYGKGVHTAPIAVRDVAACRHCPSGPLAVAKVLAALNGSPPLSLVDPMVLDVARAREAQVCRHPEGWGPEGPCAHAQAAHFAAYLLLKSAGLPVKVMPAPVRVPAVSKAFRRLAAEFRWS